MLPRLYCVVCFVVATFFALTGCQTQTATTQGFSATTAPVQANAPVYSATPSLTPTYTRTHTPTRTLTRTPSPTSTQTPAPTATASPTLSPTPRPTLPLLTLTAPSAAGAPAASGSSAAAVTTPEGWSCEDFPCEDDLEGWYARIRVPQGYTLSHVGKYPGQPMQMTYGPDGRLYATILENGTRSGAVYAMDADGRSTRYSAAFVSPVGLAFQPGTDVLYVSGRVTLSGAGGLWRVLPNGQTETVLDDLPCCFSVVGSQPSGLIFGPDGYLYLAVGALTDHLEPADPQHRRYAELHPYEASILRIQPHTGEVSVFAQGLRDPYDLTFDSTGQYYATDNGIVEGPGDRVLALVPGGHYGWPYWRERGCAECPLRNYSIEIRADLLSFPPYTLPRGLTAYTATQFPQDMFDDLFVVLWNGVANGQRVVRIDPRTLPTDPETRAAFVPEPFVTGLIRPVDITIAPDGSLVVADFIYGHVWRVSYAG